MGRFVVIEAIGVGGSGRVVLVEDRLRPGPGSRSRSSSTQSRRRDRRAEPVSLRHWRRCAIPAWSKLRAARRSQTGARNSRWSTSRAQHRRDRAARRPQSLVPLAAEICARSRSFTISGSVHRDLSPATSSCDATESRASRRGARLRPGGGASNAPTEVAAGDGGHAVLTLRPSCSTKRSDQALGSLRFRRGGL